MDRRIAVRLSDAFALDNVFHDIRNQFLRDMRQMDDEMNIFHSHILPRQDELFDHSFVEALKSPLVQNEGDGKSLKLRFDVSHYTPEEVEVKTVDNKLQVHAKHEEKSDTKYVYREYKREFLLPKGVNPEQIQSSLSKDGVLSVEAPLPQQALEAPK